MKFLSSTTSSNPDTNAECDYALIEIGREAAAQICARHAVFMDLRAKDADLLEMYFWDGLPTWFAGNEDQFEKMGVESPNGAVIEVSGSITFDDSDFEVQRTECDQMILCEEGVRWTAIPKHTSIYVTSETIPIATIRKLLEEG